jgi:hypothetical protein
MKLCLSSQNYEEKHLGFSSVFYRFFIGFLSVFYRFSVFLPWPKKTFLLTPIIGIDFGDTPIIAHRKASSKHIKILPKLLVSFLFARPRRWNTLTLMHGDEERKEIIKTFAAETLRSLEVITQTVSEVVREVFGKSDPEKRCPDHPGFLAERMGLSEHGFNDSFRMSKTSFRLLRDILSLESPDGSSINTDELLGSALYFLAHACKYRVLEDQFGISKSYIHEKMTYILRRIVECLGGNIDFIGNYVDLQDAWIKHVRFEPFRGVIGALDGTLIPYKGREKDFSRQLQWYSRKGFHAVNCVVVCDSKMRICRFATGAEGSTHDERALSFTTILDSLPHNSFLIADAGYSLRANLVLIPHRSVRYHVQEHGVRAARSAKELFNLRHSSLRIGTLLPVELDSVNLL